MITDPRFAPRRTDLPYLRRRSRPKQAAVPAAPAVSFDRPDRHPISFDRPERHASPPPPRKAPPPPRQPPPPPPRQPPPPQLRPAAPARSSSLDLDEPTTPSPPATAAPPAPAGPATRATSALDLDDEPARPAARAPAGPTRRQRVDARARAGTRTILTPTDPTVTLTRLQSGIGTLTIEAACSDEVGDLRLGCAYQLASGLSATVQMTQGERFAPPRSRRPVIVGGRERYERITIDLRQCYDVQRLAVYAFSEGRKPLTWGGTLLVTTFGGARIEVPLETLQGGQVAVLVSLYNIRGEFVLRAEMQTLNGDVREAARAYGYDHITWLDDRTPVE